MFANIETILGERFEDNLPDILAAAGYSSKTAIKTLCEASIAKIEQFVQSSPAKFYSILSGTRYEGTSPFHFLPGHFDILLALPRYLSEFEGKRLDKKQTQKHKEQKDDTENVVPSIGDSIITDSSQVQKELKEVLVRKIINFGNKLSVEFKFSEEHIHKFEQAGGKTKCLAQCAYCNKKTPCNYSTYWNCSNFQTHLKTHIFEEPTTSDSVQTNNILTDSNPSLVRIVETTNQQVLNLLNINVPPANP